MMRTIVGSAGALAIGVACVASMACFGGDDGDPPAATATATRARTSSVTPASTRTPAVPSRATSTAPAPVATRPPVSPGAGPIVFSPGQELTAADLAARGDGAAGRGAFNIERITVAAAGVDAPVTSVFVGSDGRMPDPPNHDVVVWYDFSSWPGLGGLPNAGGNVVMAGDALKGGVSGVFSRLGGIDPGDFVRLHLTDGSTVCYRIEFVKSAPDALFDQVVSATAEESVTLITGDRPGYRGILWGRRADCRTEPAATPTRTPTSVPTDRHTLRIVAENYAFTVVEGGVVPTGKTAVDWFIDHRDAGVEHSIAFYSPAPRQVGGSGGVLGPTQEWRGLFGVGPPDLAGEYTFVCQIHPQMTGSFMVLP